MRRTYVGELDEKETEGKWFALSKADQWQQSGMYVKHYKESLPFIEYVICLVSHLKLIPADR